MNYIWLPTGFSSGLLNKEYRRKLTNITRESLYERSWINTVSDIKVKIRKYIIHIKSSNLEDGYNNEQIYSITFQLWNRTFGTFFYTWGES